MPADPRWRDWLTARLCRSTSLSWSSWRDMHREALRLAPIEVALERAIYRDEGGEDA